jgi:hypothetical protein
MRQISLSKNYASRKAVTCFIVTQNEHYQNLPLGHNSNIFKQSTISLTATNIKRPIPHSSGLAKKSRRAMVVT